MTQAIELEDVTSTPVNLLIVDMDGTVRQPRSDTKFGSASKRCGIGRVKKYL